MCQARAFFFVCAGLFMLALCSHPAHAAQDAASPLSIGAGRLYTTEGREIAFSRFALTPDSARYQRWGEKVPTLVPASTALRVERETGNEALKGATMGGLYGLVSGVLGVWLADKAFKGVARFFREPEQTFDWGLATGIVAAGTVAGVGIGYACAAGQKTYITVYEDPSRKRP